MTRRFPVSRPHLYFTLLLFAIAAMTGCKPKPVVADDGRPAVLHLGYTPAEEIVADREKSQQALADYLERSIGIPVTLVRTASYGPALEAMARGEIDVISLAPFAYVLASREGVAEVLAVAGGRETGPRTYQSALITHRRTGLYRLEDVPGKAAKLRLNYTDPASNSGHLVPQARLAALGINPEQDFSKVDFTLSHSVAIFNVVYGKTDLAGVSASVLKRLVQKGRVSDEDLVVLWESELLPSGPVAVRAALPASLKKELQRAMLALPARDPATAKIVMSQYQEPNTVYLPGDDALYDGLRQLARRIEPAPTDFHGESRSPETSK